ncbi:MAG TPA: DUF4293 domain-containing protein [Chitinophagaceae bacterium]
MIQRQQTLWLLLASVGAFLTFQFPFLTGTKIITAQTQPVVEELDAGSTLFLLLLTVVSLILSTVTIFLFKDRKMQLKLSLTGIVLSVIILVLYILEMQKFEKTTLALYCILPLLVVVGYIMAFRGIRHDEKLVKSLDKLR